MRVALDSNVLISALKSASGASFRLIALLRSGAFQTAVTAPLVFEYEDVTSRPGLLPHFSPIEITAFLDWFVLNSSRHEIHFLWRPLLPDPKDDMVLEAAVAASVDYLVTYNTSDFREAASLGVQVVTPGQFLAHFQSRSTP